MESIDGLLLVDKPKGWTSFDVVNYVRKIAASKMSKKPKNTKVGHTGTLDPLATGLLVLCLGKFTKKVPELIKKDKIYKVEMCLGKTSDTGDAEGKITHISDIVPKLQEVENVVNAFVGEIEQTPPIYSAIKIDGKRAYQLAREGKEVVLKPRKVNVNSIKDINYLYPYIKFTADVGSGTYIRSLVDDIGENLGTGLYMSELRRLNVGEFSVKDAILPQALSEANLQKYLL